MQAVGDFVDATGTVTTGAFTAACEVGDWVMLLHPSIAMLGALDTAGATGAVTTTDYVMAYIKQIVTNTYRLTETAVANNADMTTEVADGTVISNILSKTSDTSTYSPTTDSLEMLSDKAGAFTGDGGAAQDDSVKASLDLAHTDLDTLISEVADIPQSDNAVTWNATALQSIEDEVEDELQAQNLDHLMQAAVADTTDPVDMTAEVPDDTVMSNVLTVEGDTSDFDRRTDSLEAISESVAEGFADQLVLHTDKEGNPNAQSRSSNCRFTDRHRAIGGVRAPANGGAGRAGRCGR